MSQTQLQHFLERNGRLRTARTSKQCTLCRQAINRQDQYLDCDTTTPNAHKLCMSCANKERGATK